MRGLGAGENRNEADGEQEHHGMQEHDPTNGHARETCLIEGTGIETQHEGEVARARKQEEQANERDAEPADQEGTSQPCQDLSVREPSQSDD